MGKTIDMQGRAEGLDSSKYDGYFKPAQATKPIDFAILRTSYGMYTDGIFFDSARALADSDVPVRMVYHYLSSGADPVDQVSYFLDKVGKSSIDPHAYWIDFEGAYNEMSIDFAIECSYAVKKCIEWTGKTTGIYTNVDTYDRYISKSGTWHTNTPLWIAWPTSYASTPLLPEGRAGSISAWDIWQYSWTGKGTDYGTARASALDLDIYDGTLEELLDRFCVDIPNPPPPPSIKLEHILTVGENRVTLEAWAT